MGRQVLGLRQGHHVVGDLGQGVPGVVHDVDAVQSFLRGIHIVDYTRDALAEVAHHVVTLAEAEDLPAHGAAIKARFAGGERDEHSEWKVPESK